MKNIFNKKLFIMMAMFFAVAIFFSASSVHASTPVVAASLTGGDSVSLNITGDPNSGVILNYLGNSGVQMSALGTTNSYGSFSITISTAAYGIVPASLFAVTVNNQRSVSQNWPYTVVTSTSSSGSISLSQTSATLAVGQSVTITAYNNASSLYLSSNTNPAVANVTINGNQFTILANSSGTTTVTVCSLTNSSNCASVSVTGQSTNTSSIAFSQSNVTVGYGQDVSITIAGGTGSYSVSNNSNPGVIQGTINGASLTLHALTTSGSATLTVCSSDMSSCGVVNVTASATSSSSTLVFSQSNPSVVAGQTAVVTISGGSGTYYISANSSPSMAQVNLVGNQLTIFGNSIGASLLTICASNGGCGVLPINITAQAVASLSLSPTSVSVSIGQSVTVTATGAGGYYVASNSNPSIASATVNNYAITVSGLSVGTSNINICQSGGQCTALYVTVSGMAVTVPATSITSSVVLTTGQGVNLFISGGTAPYYLSSNSGSVFTAVLTSGSILTLTGVSAGNASVNVCSSNGGCLPIYVVVVPPTSVSTSSSSSSSAEAKYMFSNPLKLGDQGSDVEELQTRLSQDGYFTGSATGYYGSLTEAAVKKYQAAHKLTPLGNVGPGTRAALNAE